MKNKSKRKDQSSTNNTNNPDDLPAIPVKKKRGRKKKVVPGLALDPSVDLTSKNTTKNIPITSLDGVDASLQKKSTISLPSNISESLTPSKEFNGHKSNSKDNHSIELSIPDSELIEDESEIDAEGEKKIDSLGNLLGDREFVIPTFSFPNRMNSKKRYVLFSHILKLTGSKDTNLLFQKYPLLKRVESTQEERDYLVNEGWVYQTFRWRSAYLVSARNFFRSFGAMSIKNGKHILDDYWESLKLESGDFTPGETVDIRNFTIKRFTIPGQPPLAELSKTPLKQKFGSSSKSKDQILDVSNHDTDSAESTMFPSLVHWPPLEKFEDLKPPSFEIYSDLINDAFDYSAPSRKSVLSNTILGDSSEIPLNAALKKTIPKNNLPVLANKIFSENTSESLSPSEISLRKLRFFNRKLLNLCKSTHGVIYEPHTNAIHLPKNYQPNKIDVLPSIHLTDNINNNDQQPIITFIKKTKHKPFIVSNPFGQKSLVHHNSEVVQLEKTKIRNYNNKAENIPSPTNSSQFKDLYGIENLLSKQSNLAEHTMLCNKSIRKKRLESQSFIYPISIIPKQFQDSIPIHNTRFGQSVDQSLNITKKSLLTSLFSANPSLINNHKPDRKITIAANNTNKLNNFDHRQAEFSEYKDPNRFNPAFINNNKNVHVPVEQYPRSIIDPSSNTPQLYSRYSSLNSFSSNKTNSQSFGSTNFPILNHANGLPYPYPSLKIQNSNAQPPIYNAQLPYPENISTSFRNPIQNPKNNPSLNHNIPIDIHLHANPLNQDSVNNYVRLPLNPNINNSFTPSNFHNNLMLGKR
ncbi:Chromatin structure-remodeling complex subunit RSC7 [Smittium culicis]|uniref:Chromatin structure-remodeling complex subunit RSC7 n=1 Tax=Smittium culicis TaxID=133412 RepID=A0A1R1XCK5_9FUNG|nr:Chromatin structure-remodeling complex subunit RSC7 [Smittium culicis]